MSESNAKKWGVVVGAGILATFGFLSNVSGELVFDDQSPAETATRENLRNEVAGDGAASAPVPQPAPVIVQAPAAQAAQPTVVVQTAAPAAPAEESISNLSRAELIRRSRMREELKNEDILQTRLEELRLRDEQARTGQLLGGDGAAAAAPVPVTQGLQETVVVPPVTERPGEPAPLVTDSLVTAQAAPAALPAAVPAADDGEFTITGRGGLSNMVGNNSYNVQSRFTAGVGAGVGVSENIEFEIGYAYSEYGVAMNSTNPFVQYVQSAQYYGASYYPAAGGGTQPVFETIVAKQNVFDGGLKVKLLGADSKLRPFLGGGAGYSKSYVNYDQRFLDWMRNSPWYVPGQEDYSASSFLGYLTTGFDLSLSKNVAVGANFRYYTVLTARENQSLNNMAFMPTAYGYPYNYGYGYGATATDADKQSVGGSLARSGFYSILAGVTFKF